MPIRSYKTELHPNNVQATMLTKHAGCSRFVYNWALSLLKINYEQRLLDEKAHFDERKHIGLPEYTKQELKEYRKSVNDKYIQPSAITLHKILNSKKKSEFPWMYEVSKWAPQNALYDLENAYKKFFTGKSKFPKFKKKGIKDSFTLNNPVVVGDSWIQLPKIGKVRLYEKNYIPIGKPKSATISKKAGRWFVSVYYEVEIPQTSWSKEVIGVDLGIKTLMTCSDGTTINNSTKLKELEASLKRQQKKLSRQVKGSKSRNKTKEKIQKLHFRISNSRKDIIHKATSLLVKTKSEGTIVIEDLNVKGMMKNHKLSKAIGNCGFYEFRRQIEYKSKWYGKNVIVADRFFPSSKTDHKSGEYLEGLKLSDRMIYHSDGTQTDRDLNAAINLKHYGERILSTVRYTEINAGGDERFILSKDKRCSSKKPEENIKS